MPQLLQLDKIIEVPELHEIVVHKEVLIPVEQQVVKEAARCPMPSLSSDMAISSPV